jgi:hypothetical protein
MRSAGAGILGCAVLLVALPCALNAGPTVSDELLPDAVAVPGFTAPATLAHRVALGSIQVRSFSVAEYRVHGVLHDGAGSHDNGDGPLATRPSSTYLLLGHGGSGSDKSEGREAAKASGLKPRLKVGGGYLWLRPDYGFMNSGSAEFAFSQTEYQSRSGGGFADLSVEFELVTRTRGSLGLCLRTFYHRESLKDGNTDIDMEWLSLRIGLAVSVPVGHTGMISETGVRLSSCLFGLSRIKVTGLPVQNSIYRWWWRDRETLYGENELTSYAGHIEAGWYFILMDAVDLNVYGLTDWGTGFASWGVGVRASFLLRTF